MANVKAVAKALIKSLVFVPVFYAWFRFLGDFSSQQSAALTLVLSLGYGLYEALNASSRVDNVFSPFCVSIYPNWHELLSDFKLVRSVEECHQLGDELGKVPASQYHVFRSGFTFTVIRPPSDKDPMPGLTFLNDRKAFRTDVELFESLIKDESLLPRLGEMGEKHPFFNHPKWPSPSLFFKPGIGGYTLGLEVGEEWWKHLCESGEMGELGKIKSDTDHSCGTTRLVIATLPYSEFGLHYQALDYARMEKGQDARDKQLEAHGWKRKDGRGREISVAHKYFTVSHWRV